MLSRTMTAAALLALGVSLTSGSMAAQASTSAEGELLYVTNSALRADPTTANVARFTLDAAGQASPAGTARAGAGARGLVFTSRPNAGGDRFAYLASQNDNEINRYKVAADGTLAFVGATPAVQPFGIARSPRDDTVYVANFDDGAGSGSVSAYRVGPSGDLTLLNAVDSGAESPKGVAVTPDGQFVYVSHGAQENEEPTVLVGFAVASDGSLRAPVAKGAIGHSGHRVVITPDGRFVYVTNQESDPVADVYGFRIGAQGHLTPVPNSPVEAGVWTEGAAASPDGTRLFITALGVVGPVSNPVADGQVRGFAIASDGALTEISRTHFGFDPVDLAFGGDGQHLYVADFSSDSVTVFAVSSGHLRPVQTVKSQGPNPGFQGVTVRRTTS